MGVAAAAAGEMYSKDPGTAAGLILRGHSGTDPERLQLARCIVDTWELRLVILRGCS